MKQSNLVSFLGGAAAVGTILAMTGVPQGAGSSDMHRHQASATGSTPVSERAANTASNGGEQIAALDSTSATAKPEESFSYNPIESGKEPVQAIPGVEEFFEDYLELDYEPAKIALGKQLFHDTRLSSDNTLSCSSCHDLRYAGIDRSATATGVRGQVGPINTPTVFNSAFNFSQFWDGRASDLEAQADGPPNADGEMDSNWDEITSKLSQDKIVMDLLGEAWPDEDFSEGIDSKFWLDAIADFERTLITPAAPFDQYLLGDADAISEEAKEGYQVFKDVGCTECHSGMAVGGKSFQRLGRKRPYFDDHTGGVDLGRFNITGKDEDRHQFKVPALRNVALTGPWFHDGTQESLSEAVRSMGEFQLDLDLTEGQVDRIVAFLVTLTGEYEGRSLRDVQNTPASKL